MKRLNLKIENPCAEKWQNFEKRGFNGFCKTCQKEVVDFTRMSEVEIKNYFIEKKSTSNLCGKIRIDQQKKYVYKQYPFLSLLKTGILGAGSLLFFPTSVHSQTKDLIEVHPQYNVELGTFNGTLSGKVVDDSGESLPGVIIKIERNGQTAYSDIDGEFLIDVKSNDTLIFSYVGFEDKYVQVEGRSSMSISMSEAMLGGLMGEVVVVRKYSPKNLWWRIKGLFRQ